MVTIRELTFKDAAAFQALRRRAAELNEDGFASAMDTWTEEPVTAVADMLRNESESLHDFILGAFVEGMLIGVIGFFRPTQPTISHTGHVWGMFVAPEWRGQGVAGKLLDAIIQQARHMSGLSQLKLTTINRYKAPLALYRSRGFRIIATEKRMVHLEGSYYDELYMALTL